MFRQHFLSAFQILAPGSNMFRSFLGMIFFWWMMKVFVFTAVKLGWLLRGKGLGSRRTDCACRQENRGVLLLVSKSGGFLSVQSDDWGIDGIGSRQIIEINEQSWHLKMPHHYCGWSSCCSFLVFDRSDYSWNTAETRFLCTRWFDWFFQSKAVHAALVKECWTISKRDGWKHVRSWTSLWETPEILCFCQCHFLKLKTKQRKHFSVDGHFSVFSKVGFLGCLPIFPSSFEFGFWNQERMAWGLMSCIKSGSFR